jgi:hypothetical protein
MMRNLYKKTRLVLVALLMAKASLAQQWDGLTLYANMNNSFGYLVDTAGSIVKTWPFTGNTAYSTHMVPGGDVFRSVVNSGNWLTGGGMSGRVQKVSYAGVILWDYTYSSATYCLHHDICPMPNGNLLVISYDVKAAGTATAAGSSTAIAIWSEKVMELQPVGSNSAVVVWEWKLWDHLVQDVNPAAANYQTSIVNNPQLLNINYKTQKDWIHMNGIDYNPVLDQIVVSSHNLNEWYVIDHSTTTAEAASHSGGNAGKGGDFLYRWGNPLAYGAGGTAILNVTHDAHWVPEGSPGAGNLAGINNKGVITPNTRTTADAITPPRLNYNYTISPGSAYTPASFDSRYISTGYTTNMGSTEQYPNGNQMVCLATVGTILEIDAAGNLLWSKSTGGFTPQAHRYSQCYIDSLAPPQPSISLSGIDLIATPAAAYQWYMNGNLLNGATSQTYTPTQAGIYVVRTTNTYACVKVYSAGFPFGVATGINKNKFSASNIYVYPNPTSDLIDISVAGESLNGLSVLVFDNSGTLVKTVNNSNKIDLSELPVGLYLLNITNPGGVCVAKKVSVVK